MVRGTDKAHAAAEAALVAALPSAKVSGSVGLQEALAENPTVAVVIGDEAAQALFDLKPTMPVVCVMTSRSDSKAMPPKSVVVGQTAHPARQARVLKALVPGARSVGIIFTEQTEKLVDDYAAAAKEVGVEVVRYRVSTRRDVSAAVKDMTGVVSALWLVPDPKVVELETLRFMLKHSLENKLPIVGFGRNMAKVGALLSFEVSPEEQGKRAAAAAKAVLAGKPGGSELIEGALLINGRTARALGLSVTQSLRSEAETVFE